MPGPKSGLPRGSLLARTRAAPNPPEPFNWHIFRLWHNLVDSPAMLEKRVAVGLMAWAVLALGCDDKPAAKATPEPTSVTTSVASAPPKPPPDPLAGLTVDELGLYLQTHRIDMGAKDAETKQIGRA